MSVVPREAPREASREAHAREPGAQQTIALVDDDRNILTSVAMTLEQEGFQVRTFTDGESALQGLSTAPGRPRGARHQDAAHGRDGAAAAAACSAARCR